MSRVWELALIVGSILFVISVASEPASNAETHVRYNRDFLLELSVYESYWNHNDVNIPTEIKRTVNKEYKRKRGKRGGVRQRLKKRKTKVPLPTIILSNVQSLKRKADELRVNTHYLHEYREACILAFSETWLNDTVLDSEVCPEGFSLVRLDRCSMATGKDHGGGVCVMINVRWCKTTVVRKKICTKDIELLSVSMRPSYLPREFPQIFLTVVYIHPRADINNAADIIFNVTQELDKISPDAPKFIMGDFNNCTLKKILTTYSQYVTCPTRKDKIIDL